jgi:hypothetical protein
MTTFADMKSKLLTLEQVHTLLAATEPLAVDHLSDSSRIRFRLDAGWETTLEALDGLDLVNAFVSVNGTEHQMTKDAALQAASNVGVPGALVKKTPAKHIETLLNHFYGPGLAEDGWKMLTVQGTVSAFIKPKLAPFSNLMLLDNALEGIYSHYGSNTEVLADYKISNSLNQTDVRLIIPEADRVMHNTGMTDIPAGSEDLWSAGLHLSNSITGKKMTEVSAYLFRWWCTNGATEEADGVGKWNRRTNGQEEDVYRWAKESVEEVLGGMEFRFDQVQALTSLDVDGNKTADVLKEIFSQYEVPVSQREAINTTLIRSPELTMYTVMQAITEVANTEDLAEGRVDRLMRIGGDIPTTVFDTLKAKIWREGHTAAPEQPNPYEIMPLEDAVS